MSTIPPCPICKEVSCMGNECSPHTRDEEDQAHDQWIEELASKCEADDKPCAGCQQGSVCDGINTSVFDDDDYFETNGNSFGDS